MKNRCTTKNAVSTETRRVTGRLHKLCLPQPPQVDHSPFSQHDRQKPIKNFSWPNNCLPPISFISTKRVFRPAVSAKCVWSKVFYSQIGHYETSGNGRNSIISRKFASLPLRTEKSIIGKKECEVKVFFNEFLVFRENCDRKTNSVSNKSINATQRRTSDVDASYRKDFSKLTPKAF